MKARVEVTNCRVLSYNYDRLFECSFLKWAKKQVSDTSIIVEQEAVNWLNISLRNPGNVKIVPDRFALIKLHGGIGQFNRDGGHGMNHVYPFKLWEPLPPMDDNPYFIKPGQESNEQTIFYPVDKRKPQDVLNESDDTDSSSLRSYEKAVWKTAILECSKASEIQIIGYSMQSIDWFWFKELFRKAEKCRKVVIRNHPNCLTDLVQKMERLADELGIAWKVEARAENFFGKPYVVQRRKWKRAAFQRPSGTRP